MQLLPVEVKGAVTKARGKTLFGPVDLTLDGHGVTVVIGPNGSGKTSFLRMLHGISRLNSGSITWACPLEDARKRQAFVFQTPVMLRRSVIENLIYPLQVDGLRRAIATTKAKEWAARIGLSAALNRPATRLSGGERQKLALARALIRGPQVLFLDEPTSALDGRATKEIEALLTKTARDGTRLIMSTHDMGQARRLADEIIFVLHGKIHERAEAKAFFAGPKTHQAAAFLQGDIVE